MSMSQKKIGKACSFGLVSNDAACGEVLSRVKPHQRVIETRCADSESRRHAKQRSRRATKSFYSLDPSLNVDASDELMDVAVELFEAIAVGTGLVPDNARERIAARYHALLDEQRCMQLTSEGEVG